MTKKIKMILASTYDGVIGLNGDMPWNIPEDMSFFRVMTMGSTVVMGRKTYESIGGPLADRENIVLSTNRDYKHHGVRAETSILSAIESAENDSVFIAGGGCLYNEAIEMDIVDEIFLTVIYAHIEGDTHVDMNKIMKYNEISRNQSATEQGVVFEFVHLIK